MNGRQFIKSTVIAAGAFALKSVGLLRGEAEIPVTLGNRSVFAALWDEQGIKLSDVKRRVVDLSEDKGVVVWVDWSKDGPGDDSNDGLLPYTPLKMTQSAIDKVEPGGTIKCAYEV